MKIALGSGGDYLEPDDGPRDTKYHMRIVRSEPVPNTRSAFNITLECGHGVTVIGNLALALGVLKCTKCRDLDEEVACGDQS